mgnify:CR=1 FL=1
MQPKYLFVDEPNSGLDPQTSILIDDLINEITEEYKMIRQMTEAALTEKRELEEDAMYV